MSSEGRGCDVRLEDNLPKVMTIAFVAFEGRVIEAA